MRGRKTLGIIGGMGSVAAAYLFKRIVELTPAKTDQEYIETFIHNNTGIPDRTRGILHGGESPLPELKRSIAILNDHGVDYIAIACMTSHYFIEDLQKNSKAKIINAIEETARYTAEKMSGIKKVGILASTGAIKLSLFQDRLHSHGIETVILNDADQNRYFMEPIYEEWGVKTGHATGRPRDRFKEAVEILRKSGAEAIVAGCSELPLVLSQEELSIRLIDTIDILAEATVNLCLERR